MLAFRRELKEYNIGLDEKRCCRTYDPQRTKKCKEEEEELAFMQLQLHHKPDT